jgi:hypothetical protein
LLLFPNFGQVSDLFRRIRKCVRRPGQYFRHPPSGPAADRADVVDPPAAFLPDKIEQQLARLAEIIEGRLDFRVRFGIATPG